jgi:lipid-A-disaccharide synthase
MRVFIVAGELSGDLLGAALIEGLRQRVAELDVRGVAGPAMQAAGCQPLASIEALSLMGIAEVLPALPRLFRLRARLIDEALRFAPDVVVGIDAPDFNLGLERRLRARGLRCVHLVSPTIWAWRKGRLKTIAQSVDQMLCLFPFEPAHYAGSGVDATFIGHPLADQLDDATGPEAGRAALSLPERPTLAVLPGSRGGEVRHLMPPFAEAATRLARERPDLQLITPIAKPSLRAPIEAAIQAAAPGLTWHCLDGNARAALRAADAVLLASGTATLETLLLGRPMVVAYRTSPITAWLLLKAGLLKTRHVSLPNLLASEPTVPERLQEACTPQQLAADLRPLLDDPAARRRQLDRFAEVRAQLALDAGQRAADAILAALRR